MQAERPSIFVYYVRGARVLHRRTTGAAARHAVNAVDARMYAKRVNHYGMLLAEALARRRNRARFSLAVDLRDIPHDDPEALVCALQRRLGGGNPLLPDVDFFHHGWHLSNHDPWVYGEKSITAAVFAGASIGRELTAEDMRRHASERLALMWKTQPRRHGAA